MEKHTDWRQLQMMAAEFTRLTKTAATMETLRLEFRRIRTACVVVEFTSIEQRQLAKNILWNLNTLLTLCEERLDPLPISTVLPENAWEDTVVDSLPTHVVPKERLDIYSDAEEAGRISTIRFRQDFLS